MKPSTTSACPYQPDPSASNERAPQPPGSWPPGPRTWLTGWSLLRHMARDPLAALGGWRSRYGDLVHLRIWPEHQIVVTDPHLVRELLVDHHNDLIRWERGIQVFSQLHGNSVIIAEGEPWRVKRHALQPSFMPKTVQSAVPVIAAAAAKAFSQWDASGKPWPVEHGFTSLGMDVILRMTFSSEIDADARLAEQAVHDVSVAANTEMFWPASWPDWLPWKRTKRTALRTLDRLVERHLDARLALAREQWPEDTLSRLLHLHRDDPENWPLKAVRDECMTTFLAGHETAAATLTWWAWCMAANPAVQSTAQREVGAVLQGRAPTAKDLPALGYVAATLQETLRLYPAAPILLSRRSVRPFSLGGWQFPARTMFSVPVQLMHHDARWFPDPLAFRPERFLRDAPPIPRGAFMPFGAGPRVCLGQHLALAEMSVIAAMFLQRFSVTPAPGTGEPTPVFNITLRPGSALRLTIGRNVIGPEPLT